LNAVKVVRSLGRGQTRGRSVLNVVRTTPPLARGQPQVYGVFFGRVKTRGRYVMNMVKTVSLLGRGKPRGRCVISIDQGRGFWVGFEFSRPGNFCGRGQSRGREVIYGRGQSRGRVVIFGRGRGQARGRGWCVLIKVKSYVIITTATTATTPNFLLLYLIGWRWRGGTLPY
jgi:hypothetical protein